MTKAQNEALARRYRAELWHDKLEIADEIFTPDVRAHVSDSLTPEIAPGLAAFKQLVTMYNAAFPDTRYEIEDIVVDETKAAVRWTARGTHQGALGEIAPTSKSVSVTGIDICHFRDGRITDVWTSWDALGMLKQLGLMDG